MKNPDTIRSGTWISTGSPAIVELAAECGLDWVLLDLEHGEYGESEIPHLLRALRGSETLGIVRVAALLPDQIGRTLDCGADGIMVPHVTSAEQARIAARAMRYPPEGTRGVSRTVRAHGYGTRDLATRNSPFLLAQIEDPGGVRAAESIAAVAGVDALFIGPADLRHALAHEPNAPGFEDCVETTLAGARAHGKATGILIREPDERARRVESGMTWIASGSDLGILREFYQHLKKR